MCYISEDLYYVYERENSATRENVSRLLEGLNDAGRLVYMMKDNNVDTLKYAEKDYLDSCYWLYKVLWLQNKDSRGKVAKNRIDAYIKKMHGE